MRATLYALKCQKCGGLLKKISSDESYHTYTCVNNACKIYYARVYIDNRFVEIIDNHTSSKKPAVPSHCPACGQPSGTMFAPAGVDEVECSICKTKSVYNTNTKQWEVVEDMGV